MVKLLIVGLLNGEPTPFDGQWVVEYDPSRRGVDPLGKPMIAHLVTTADPLEAREFPSFVDAEECWKQTYGSRKDGRPNRPLTAFIVEMQSPEKPPGKPARPRQRQDARVTFVAEFFYA